VLYYYLALYLLGDFLGFYVYWTLFSLYVVYVALDKSAFTLGGFWEGFTDGIVTQAAVEYFDMKLVGDECME